MAWQDRSYYRDRGYGSGGNPLMWLLTGSVSLGTWFGINVRVHASLIFVIALTLIFPNSVWGWRNAWDFVLVLFGIVLLHEFGHCVGSRMVGGRPTQIMMTPLGGLAFADAPHRPWATFWTVLCGPLVNVLICLVASAYVAVAMHSWRAVPFNPAGIAAAAHDLGHFPADVAFVWWVYTISYALFLFNLWPVFPLDGGQMLQSLLWVKFGYYRATYFATVTGMIGAGVMLLVGLTGGNILLMLIAMSGFMTCFQLYRELKANGPWAYQEDSADYSAAYEQPERRKKVSTRQLRRAQKLEQEAAAEQEQIDRILAKVSAKGMNSLTWFEKRALQKATERQRQRDLELSQSRRRH